TAAVLAGAGFEVLVMPGPIPTPLTAFAVLHHRAVAGIMITASHNPPQDNGYKLYLGDGAQIVPPVDAEISAHIDAVGPLAEVPLSTEGVRALDGAIVDAYLDRISTLVQPWTAREVSAVYTAMHGVAAEVLRLAFERVGFPPPHEVA